MVEAQVKNEEFSKEQIQIMQKATEQLNTIIQKQPNLKDHQVTIAQENGKMFLYIKTNDGQPINEKFGEALHKAVLDLKGKEFVAAGMALQQGGCDAKEFERVSKNETSQQALRNLLSKSSIGISKETSEEKGEGEGKGAKAYAFKNQDLRNEEKRINDEIVKKEFEKRIKEGKKATHEDSKEAFGKILTDEVKKEKSLTGAVKDEKGTIVATTLATGAKANEEITKQEVKGVVAIIRDDNVEKQILDGSKKVSDGLYEKTKINEKDKTKFGTFKDKDGNIIARMKHANGKWKDSILADKKGNLNEETLRELCYVANIYEKDTSTKSREKNNISLEESKEIRKIITDYVFSIPGVEEAYKQADEKYQKDRPGYKLSRDGFAVGYLYEILKQKK